MSTTPITFTQPSWLLFDTNLNAALTTEFGNLAIFSTKGMAELWARGSHSPHIVVRQVSIKPMDN